MALKLDNSLLEELGLGALPDAEKQLLLRQIYEKLEMNVGMRLADQMSNEQLDAFEKFVDANDDKGAFQWLESNFPNYKMVVNEEFEKLKIEIKSVAPQILANAVQTEPAVGQQSYQPQVQPQQQPTQQPQNQPQQYPPVQSVYPQQQPSNQQYYQPAMPPSSEQPQSPTASAAPQAGHLQPQYGTPSSQQLASAYGTPDAQQSTYNTAEPPINLQPPLYPQQQPPAGPGQ